MKLNINKKKINVLQKVKERVKRPKTQTIDKGRGGKTELSVFGHNTKRISYCEL